VNAIEPLRNGYFASGSKDHTIIIWSITTFTLVNTLNNNHIIYFLCELSTGVLASSDWSNNINFWNYTATSNQLLSSYTGISTTGSNDIRAIEEVNGQLYVSDDREQLYIFSETTYALLTTLTGTSKIVAMSASADGLNFAAALSNPNNFAYFAASTRSITTPQAQSNANTRTIKAMDRWGTFFVTLDDQRIWAWLVNETSATGFMITTASNNPNSIACFNGKC
jgi:WD40 repeat protein